MKYLKKYKIFDSKLFSENLDIKDIMIELVDDHIITKCEFIDSGYIYFTQMWNRKIQSELYYDMANFPEKWEFRKPDELMGETWKELFLNVESDGITKSMLNRNLNYIFLNDNSRNLYSR